MVNTLANTSIYQSDLSGFKKPIWPSKPQGNQNYSASSYLNNAPAFQQVALWMAKWNSPQAETQARYGGSPKSSKSTQSSSKSTTPTLPNKSTLPTPPSTKRSSSVYTPPVPAIPGANPLDELYKRTPPPIKAELEAPKVATTTTPVIDLTKKQDDVYTPANYDFIDTMDIKGLKNLQRSFQYDIQTGKTLTKDQQLQMLYAQDRIGDLTSQQTMTNPVDPMIEQQQQAKLQRQAELEAEQNQLITSQQENERQYIESQNILFKQAEEEQKKVMWYILWWQGAETSSYWAEQLNKIGMNFAWQKQSLLAESNARIQKYRAELSGATREELNNYDKNIQQLQLQSAQFDFDNLKAINEYNMQEWKDLASKFGALYETSLLQEKQKTPLTQEEIAQAWYYSNFLVKDDWSLDNNVLSLLEKTNPLLINSAVQQGIAIQKERMNKWWDYSFANLWWWQIAVQDPKTWKVEFIQGNRQNEYDYQKDTEWNVYAINKTNPNDTKLVVQWSTQNITSEWIWDLTYLRSQFPTEARSGTNNPAGITWNTWFDQWTWTAKILADNGIVFEKWNPRPKGEWWNYVKFRTMDDWLKAQRLIMTQTYGNTTVNNMLDKRVWTGNIQYAKDIAKNAGINLNVKVNSLNENDLDILQSAKIQRESPWLYKVLSWITQWWDQSQWPLTDPYIKTLFSNIQDLYKGTAQQATLNEQVEWLKDNPEQLKAFLLNQYASKKLSTEEKNRYDKSTSNAEQAQSLLDTLEYYNNQGFEYNNWAWSRAGRAIDRWTARLWLWNIEEATQKFDELNSSLQEAGAERRNKIFGASLTTNEQWAAKPFIVQTTDLLPEIIAKLKAQKMVSEIAKERQIAEKLWMSYNSLAKIKEVQARFKQELWSDTTQSNTNPWILANPDKPTTTTNERVDQHLKDLWII